MKKFLCYDTNDAASGKINVDSRGMLKPNSTVPSTNGTAYQYLVTDGEGNVKWEDRLAYEDSRVVVDTGGIKLVMVSDEVPSWASGNVAVKCWVSKNAQTFTVQPEQFVFLDNGSFFAGFVSFITTDNSEAEGVVFPKKGVYFASSIPGLGGASVTGVASADSDTPEITWDGSLYTIKQIDEKFIPSTSPNIPKNYRVVFEKTSSNVFQCNCTYSELKDFAVAGYPIYGVLLNRIVPTDAFQYNMMMVRNDDSGHRMEFEFATGEGGTTRLYYDEDGHISNEAPIG